MKDDSIARGFTKKHKIISSDIDEKHHHDEDDEDHCPEASLDGHVTSGII